MNNFLTSLKEEIKNKIYKRKWIVDKLNNLSTGVDISADFIFLPRHSSLISDKRWAA
ncbi:hypothetical protein GNF10_23895 [Nostoc sp. UCD121]|uniref:hypothetical protein n=1 Tax=unclassified Nostoc TaxID=2593658 RepID=UPI001628EF88|nr:MULTISPECIES: hypothetical protein [unclassified Nostoc]MBC1225144.1 hypothetical protein [Nostoc sp. UCD120]MBC1278926.1 hypothetical protein [Nostoc sp. UCD121]MBC1295088.1 hypothetical protein [Nostoc sp. UCD122]